MLKQERKYVNRRRGIVSLFCILLFISIGLSINNITNNIECVDGNVDNITTTSADITTTTIDTICETNTGIHTYNSPDTMDVQTNITVNKIQPETTSVVTTNATKITTTPKPKKNKTDEELQLLGNLRITGYVATGGKTASGDTPFVGGVAMSRSYGLPWGTKIYIEGLGYYTLNDTGCRTGVVDVFCNNVESCYDLTSYAKVYIVK